MKLKTLWETIQVADNVLTLFESGGSGNPLKDTVKDLVKGSVDWALAGGLAVGYHGAPRGTDDVDIIITEKGITELLCQNPAFRRLRPHGLEHKRTGVEVDLLTTQYLPNVDPQIIAMALNTKQDANGIPIVSREALVALKLSRAKPRDIDDIERIIEKDGPVDLSQFPLTQKQLATYREIEDRIIGQNRT